MPDTKDIEEFQRMVMDGCDANGDGKINKKELTTVLLALAKYASEEEKQQQQHQTEPEDKPAE
jgi:Ca2+-binding EF-hand superfamily protein